MENLLKQIQETVSQIRSKTGFQPQYGIILGTGLGNLANEIKVEQLMEYKDIIHFPLSTVESHGGKLIFGYIGNKRVVAMQGRFHFYEGYSMKEITFPVRLLKYLGIEKLFISNAAGGLNPKMKIGNLMIISDHISLLLSENPLRGKNHNELGLRFPDMSEVYDSELRRKALEIASKNKIVCHEGVYISVPGPCLETPAEYRFLRLIGADAVGMSTVPEVIVAHHMDLPVFAISVITDVAFHEGEIKKLTLEDVIAVAKKAEPSMTVIMKELIVSL